MKDYHPAKIEPKWQKEWEKKGIFNVKEDAGKPKYYVLEMLPYPSGRLHMGHVRNYAIGDTLARYKMMQGFNVLHPIGWDAFGMPAENAAIKNKSHPAKWTYDNIDYMRTQFKKLGISYDWKREVATCDPEYYRWEQLVFLKMYEKGIVTRKDALLNWCDTCKTVLANEQAESGKCWRCDSDVALKPMTQWFVRIPLYAEELLADIDKELQGWPERVRTMQKAWIGKSEGAVIKFKVVSRQSLVVSKTNDQRPTTNDSSGQRPTTNDYIEVFTTRPDTLYGATFMSLAAEHPLVMELSKGTPEEAKVKEFVERTKKIKRLDRISGNYEKDGVFIGAYCINPVTGWEMPIYTANFVLMDYGTGAVMAVPAHDQRDFEFAKKYGLPIKEVVSRLSLVESVVSRQSLVVSKTNDQRPTTDDSADRRPTTNDQLTEAYELPGTLINSGEFTGMESEAAKVAIINHLKKQSVADICINYKLKDWCISRQRYWGAPIPIIYCAKCGIVSVPEKDLPVKLPENVELTGEGGSPLARQEKFVNCKCPKCKSPAKRETDTMDTFVESSWYFLRYCSPKYKKGPVDEKAASYWMPVDRYIGGIEHAVGHLLYCRFYMKILRDLGLLKFSESNEPVKNLLTQGMVTLGGSAMSKSRGNIVDPDAIIEKYGADTARLFILFASPPEKDLEWNDQGVEGCWRFLNRVWRIVVSRLSLVSTVVSRQSLVVSKTNDSSDQRPTTNDVEKWTHKTIKRVTEDIERFHFNTAISAIMEFVNYLYSLTADCSPLTAIETLVLLISPFAPHMAEELWRELGHKESITKASWPKFDPAKIIEEKITVVVQVNGKLRDKLEIALDTPDEEVKKLAQTAKKVTQHLAGKQVRNIVYVPKKLVNIVVG